MVTWSHARMAILTVAVLALSAASVVLAQSTDKADPTAPASSTVPTPATQPDDWQTEFFQAYRLDRGQVIKFIPAPFPQRDDYWTARLTQIAVERGGDPPAPSHAPSSMVFLLKNTNHVELTCGLYIPKDRGGSIATLLHDLHISSLKPAVVVGPEVTDVILHGDWVIRDDSGLWLVRKTPASDAVWRGMEQILKQQTGRSIHFEKSIAGDGEPVIKVIEDAPASRPTWAPTAPAT